MAEPIPFEKCTIEPIIFFQYMQPNGGLNQHRETHALFYYFLLARKAWEEEVDGLVYEGMPDPTFNYLQLFKSISRMYGVEPEAMEKCWYEVDYTCFLHNLPKLPTNSRLRHYVKPLILLN